MAIEHYFFTANQENEILNPLNSFLKLSCHFQNATFTASKMSPPLSDGNVEEDNGFGFEIGAALRVRCW